MTKNIEDYFWKSQENGRVADKKDGTGRAVGLALLGITKQNVWMCVFRSAILRKRPTEPMPSLFPSSSRHVPFISDVTCDSWMVKVRLGTLPVRDASL